jgi:acyl carrier protein
MLRDELIGLIAEWEPGLDGNVHGDTPLITSARLDSLQLVSLLTWIEEKVGRTIDPTVINLPDDWDTVDAIVAFVERARTQLS